MEIKLIGLEGIPLVKSGDDISAIIKEAILKSDYELCDGDIILIAETLISKAEGNIIKLDDIVPSDKAVEVAEICNKDPKLVEVILQNSTEIVEVGPNFIVTETKQGFVCANAAIDESNVEDGLATPVPENPDKSASEIREFLEKEFGEEIAVIITDTQGRAFRFGAIGTAIGCSGISPLWTRVGEKDLYGSSSFTYTYTYNADGKVATKTYSGYSQWDNSVHSVVTEYSYDATEVLHQMQKKGDFYYAIQ